MRETLLIDGHVHIYPQFDRSIAIRKALDNFVIAQRTSENRDDAVKIWLLTERSDCHFFEELAGQPEIEGFSVAKTAEKESLLIKDGGTGEPLLYVLAGRQLISKERLEICALATTLQVPDRELDTPTLIRRVRESGGVPALNWAPGKWFGARGRVVRSMLDDFAGRELLISDTTMRPTFWPTPRLMALAMNQGHRVLAGSDPLPFAGEERMIATYASLVSGDFDEARPAASIRALLLDPEVSITRCGQRSGPWTWLKRQTKIMRK